LGRFDEAERILGRRLAEILTEAQANKPVSDEKLFAGASYAMPLAEGTRKGAWLDWIFQVHEAAGRLLDADAIERLYDLVRKIRYPGGGPFKSELRQMAREQGGF